MSERHQSMRLRKGCPKQRDARIESFLNTYAPGVALSEHPYIHQLPYMMDSRIVVAQGWMSERSPGTRSKRLRNLQVCKRSPLSSTYL